MIALVVFLLSSLAGVAVLTTATVNAGRYTHQLDDQQKYLSVSSAISLVKEELADFGVTSDGASCTAAGSDLFGAMSALLEQCEQYAQSGGVLTETKSVAFTLTANAEKLYAVRVEMTIGADMSLDMKFAPKDAGGYASDMAVPCSVTGEAGSYSFSWDVEHAQITLATA